MIVLSSSLQTKLFCLQLERKCVERSVSYLTQRFGKHCLVGGSLFKILLICPGSQGFSGKELASEDAASFGIVWLCRVPNLLTGPSQKSASYYAPRWSRMISYRGGSNRLRRQPGRKSSLTTLSSLAVSKSLGQTKILDFWLLNLCHISPKDLSIH